MRKLVAIVFASATLVGAAMSEAATLPMAPTKYVAIDDLMAEPELFDRLSVCVDGIFKSVDVDSRFGVLVDPPYANFEGFYRKTVNLDFRIIDDEDARQSAKSDISIEGVLKLLGTEVSACGMYKHVDNAIVVLSLRDVRWNKLY